jgi:hypothetical protein
LRKRCRLDPTDRRRRSPRRRYLFNLLSRCWFVLRSRFRLLFRSRSQLVLLSRFRLVLGGRFRLVLRSRFRLVLRSRFRLVLWSGFQLVLRRCGQLVLRGNRQFVPRGGRRLFLQARCRLFLRARRRPSPQRPYRPGLARRRLGHPTRSLPLEHVLSKLIADEFYDAIYHPSLRRRRGGNADLDLRQILAGSLFERLNRAPGEIKEGEQSSRFFAFFLGHPEEVMEIGHARDHRRHAVLASSDLDRRLGPKIIAPLFGLKGAFDGDDPVRRNPLPGLRFQCRNLLCIDTRVPDPGR